MEVKLKAKRTEYQLTQEEVAKRIGISTPTYIDKENGKRQFNLNEIKQLLVLFQCKFEDIFLPYVS